MGVKAKAVEVTCMRRFGAGGTCGSCEFRHGLGVLLFD